MKKCMLSKISVFCCETVKMKLSTIILSIETSIVCVPLLLVNYRPYIDNFFFFYWVLIWVENLGFGTSSVLQATALANAERPRPLLI